MTKTESMRTLAAILAPEDEESQSAAAPGALPGLEERVELFLRALHGSREVTALERADARRRILDAMAADLAGEPDSYVVQSVKSASATSSAAAIAPARAARAAGPSALSRAWDVLREALLWPLMISSGGHPMRLVGVACALAAGRRRRLDRNLVLCGAPDRDGDRQPGRVGSQGRARL